MFQITTKNDQNMGKIRKNVVDDVIAMTSHTPIIHIILQVTNADNMGVKNYHKPD